MVAKGGFDLAKNKKDQNEYSASDLIALDQHQQLLQNMTVTFGPMEDPSEPFCLQKDVAIREILDNGLDEIRSGHGRKLRLSFYRDRAVEIQDSGRGIPVDIGHDASGKPVSGIYLAMGVMNAGRNYTNDSKRFSSGRHGLGGASTIHASYRADITVYRRNEKNKPTVYTLSFRDGTPGFFDDAAGIDPKYLDKKGELLPKYRKVPVAALHPFTPLKDYTELKVYPDKRTKAQKEGYETGTTIKFWLSDQTFRSEKPYDDQDLVSRLRDTAFLVPTLEAEVYDELNEIDDVESHSKVPQHEFFHFPDGMDGFIELIQPDDAIGDAVHIRTTGHYVEKNAIDRTSNDDVVYHDQDREVPIDIIFRYGTGYDDTGDNIRSYVNTIRTRFGGEHLIGFQQGMMQAFNEKFQSMRGVIRKGDEVPNKDDYMEGLTAIVSVLVSAPQFTSQNKSELSGIEIRGAVRNAVKEAITEWANSPKNRDTLSKIAMKVTTAAKNRKSLADEKAAKRKKNAINSSSMPPKLSDCEFVNEPGSELLICEGLSAKAGLMKARDARYQAIFPIRGKFINSLKFPVSRVLANQEATDIIKILGCGSVFTKDFDIDNMRYDRVLLATDEDLDGLDIQDLLLVFFWKAFPEIILQGKFYVTMPPLFEIIFKGKHKKRAPEYAISDAEKDTIVSRLKQEGMLQGRDYTIHRDKGLGENDFQATWDTMMNPRNRTLKRVTVSDIQAAEEILNITMGNDASVRKEWINDNASKIDSNMLDI